MNNKKFPNGFDNWQETHFEVVTAITNCLHNEIGLPVKIREERGLGGLYELAEELTNKFENSHINFNWSDTTSFLDEIDNFLEKELYENNTSR